MLNEIDSCMPSGVALRRNLSVGEDLTDYENTINVCLIMEVLEESFLWSQGQSTWCSSAKAVRCRRCVCYFQGQACTVT
jgi:hypothetical protein